MTDLDIITRPGRSWASIHSNTPDGRDWIIRNIGINKAMLPSAFVAEYVLRIARDKLRVRVMDEAGGCPECGCRGQARAVRLCAVEGQQARGALVAFALGRRAPGVAH